MPFRSPGPGHACLAKAWHLLPLFVSRIAASPSLGAFLLEHAD